MINFYRNQLTALLYLKKKFAYGKEYEVNFILLDGDLFQDAKPTQSAILKCMDLLREYCLICREIKIQFLIDPELIFQHDAYKIVNYENPKFDVDIPIFSIHGNHDGSSFGAIGSMDLLSVFGLINYFKKWTDLTQIFVLIGRVFLLLNTNAFHSKVDMLRPNDISDFFNLFVLHQSRTQHLEYGYIP